MSSCNSTRLSGQNITQTRKREWKIRVNDQVLSTCNNTVLLFQKHLRNKFRKMCIHRQSSQRFQIDDRMWNQTSQWTKQTWSSLRKERAFLKIFYDTIHTVLEFFIEKSAKFNQTIRFMWLLLLRRLFCTRNTGYNKLCACQHWPLLALLLLSIHLLAIIIAPCKSNRKSKWTLLDFQNRIIL